MTPQGGVILHDFDTLRRGKIKRWMLNISLARSSRAVAAKHTANTKSPPKCALTLIRNFGQKISQDLARILVFCLYVLRLIVAGFGSGISKGLGSRFS